MSEPLRYRTWIEVDTGALARNYRRCREMSSPGCRIMAVAKSNAYGHGLYDFVPTVERLGADWIGVDSVVEAVSLREAGVRAPILVLGYTLPARFEDAARNSVSLTVSSFDGLAALGLSGLEEKIRVHIKIDTGLHRQGFLPGQVADLVAELGARHRRLEVEGLFTHFARAKDPGDPDLTLRQIGEFDRAAAAFAEAGYRPLRHACATAGAMLYPQAHYDMVRIGIGLTGLWPSMRMKPALEARHPLEPILAWRTIVSEVKRLPAGSGVGYEHTAVLARDSVLGICPIGYWHGFSRSLSNKGEVLVRGRKARVLGTVAMDMIIVDLTDVPGAAAEDVVTLIGRDGEAEISAAEIAAKAGQTHYEFLTRLNPLIRKIYRP